MIGYEQVKDNPVYEKVVEVYNIFRNFFHEDKVDLQIEPPNIDIVIHWPRVTVTNEYGESTDIYDLYAKVPIDMEGKIPVEKYGFVLNKSTYTLEQFECGYIHSHVPSLNYNALSIFRDPCLGTGPIRRTLTSLKMSNDELTWLLFCGELDSYVTVESIKGGPYMRLSNIGARTRMSQYDSYSFSNHGRYRDSSSVARIKQILDFDEFIRYYLTNGHLVVGFTNGIYTVGMQVFNYIMDVSNCFIDFFNQKIKDEDIKDILLDTRRGSILRSFYVRDGGFYKGEEAFHYESYIGRHVCYFKGQEITLNVLGPATDGNPLTPTLILDYDIAMCILETILDTINLTYDGNKNAA